MVDHVGVAHVDLGVGTVEDAVGQLRRVDDGAAVVLVVHGEVVALMVFHAIPGGVVMVIHAVPGGLVMVIHAIPGGVVMVIHAIPGGVVMVVQVVADVHHQAGTGVGESRRPNGIFMILEE